MKEKCNTTAYADDCVTIMKGNSIKELEEKSIQTIRRKKKVKYIEVTIGKKMNN